MPLIEIEKSLAFLQGRAPNKTHFHVQIILTLAETSVVAAMTKINSV